MCWWLILSVYSSDVVHGAAVLLCLWEMIKHHDKETMSLDGGVWSSGALSSEVKRPGCETKHSPQTSAEAKETWIYTSTPPYVFMV
jgi:hypothetical protein